SCIRNISFKGAGVPDKSGSIEAQCVQDADRLDAIGAIGIARTFAFGGHHNRTLFDPEAKPVMVTSFEQYKSQNSPTINHFYEKLFLLRDRLNTNTAKRIAANRHQYLEDFIKQFMDEWNGSDFIRESDH
ncbi:MAG: phosphohydrolase, partial [Bacteroidetes bacterium HGW-Bacteroidetes-22]